MSPSKDDVSTSIPVLNQPEVGRLIYELRQLTGSTQVQLAETLGVAYATINRWENGHIQPSPLAFKPLLTLIDELSDSSSAVLRAGSQRLLQHYFSQER